jgi:alpha-galactosidase
MRVLDVDAPLWRWAGPSGWNDADILQVGNGGLTRDEERAHFSLWSIVASPLLAGNRLPEMTPATRAILGNRRVIAVNQDRLGRQGRRVRRRRGRELWVKRLSGPCRAVLMLNRTRGPVAMGASLRRLRGVPRARRYSVADLWSARRWRATATLVLGVPSHGVRMLKACPR